MVKPTSAGIPMADVGAKAAWEAEEVAGALSIPIPALAARILTRALILIHIPTPIPPTRRLCENIRIVGKRSLPRRS